MDYLEIVLKGDPIKDKKGNSQPNILGTLATSMFKVQ